MWLPAYRSAGRVRHFPWCHGWPRAVCSCLRPSHDLSYVVSPSLSAYLLRSSARGLFARFCFSCDAIPISAVGSCLIPVVLRLHLRTRSCLLLDGAAVLLYSFIVGGLVVCWMPSFRWSVCVYVCVCVDVCAYFPLLLSLFLIQILQISCRHLIRNPGPPGLVHGFILPYSYVFGRLPLLRPIYISRAYPRLV
jgi:hypothetical protein